MRRIAVIGAGGHAREVLEILLSMRAAGHLLEPLGFVDDNSQLHGREVDGFPVLGGMRWLEQQSPTEIELICAVGAPAVRQRLVGRAASLGYRFASAISPLALVSARARIGSGAMIFPNAVVGPSVSLGDHVILNVGATVSHDSRLGHFCTVNPGVHVAGNVTVCEGCSIGMGANVIQGTSIGDWTTIGAGAVVIRDLPSHVTAVGVPARVTKEHQSNQPS
jgi:sugar O-acyltransferase (sialic acid O-acetyltransferase NeuD family)